MFNQHDTTGTALHTDALEEIEAGLGGRDSDTWNLWMPVELLDVFLTLCVKCSRELESCSKDRCVVRTWWMKSSCGGTLGSTTELATSGSGSTAMSQMVT